MSDDLTTGADRRPGAPASASFFTPPVCAVAAFTLAVVALLGQNVVTLGISTVFASGFGPGEDAFYLGWGVATALQVTVVLLLARRTFGLVDRWEATLGRAAVIVSAVAIVAAVLVVAGTLLTDGAVGL